jgi:4-hydroxy-3-methylbut-2-enyl diphosphate reductase
MITAHGTSDRQRRKWREAGFDIADGTCPLVRHAHEQLRRLVVAGYFPVVIGQACHVEVRGLVEDFADAFVLNAIEQIPSLPARNRYGIISQTTQPIEHVRQLVEAIRSFHPAADVLFVDTVCKPTKDRQSALQRLLAQVDAVVVVGGHESNNTRQLVETCRAAGRRAFHVERPADIDAIDFTGVAALGLTAGTSTLPQTVDAVLERLQKVSSAAGDCSQPQAAV